jgi:hypothetical protein
LEVLEGLRDCLCASRPILLIEILPLYSSDNIARRTRQERIEVMMSELKYSLLRVVKGKGQSLQCLQGVETIGIHSDLSQCDYVVVPTEIRESIKRW